MSEKKIFSHPGHEMIFKCSLYNLMKKVRRDKLVDVGTGEIICKGLKMKT
jgi:hypothetical protein